MYANNFDQNSMAGRTLGPELSNKIANSIPPVGIVLEQLEKELHYLREHLNLLNNRLSPAMRPMPATGNTVPDCRNGGSPMVAHIESLTQLVRSASADVGAMLDCLEL